MKKNMIIYISIVIAIIMLALTMISSYNSIASNEYSRLQNQLQELASAQSDFVKSYIGDIIGRLKIEAYYISKTCDLRSQDADSQLNTIIKSAIKDNTENISARVMFVKTIGDKKVVSDPYFDKVINAIDFSDSMVFGNDIISQVFTEYDSENFIVISVPIKNPDNNEISGVLGGVYTTDDLRNVISNNCFDGEGYVGIVQQDGTFVLRSDNDNADSEMTDLFSTNKYSFAKGYSFDSLKKLILEGKKGFTRYTRLDGEERFACFMPIGISNWRILLSVPIETLVKYSGDSYYNNIVMAIKLFAIFLGLLLVIEISRRMSNRELLRVNDEMKKTNDNLRISDERFKIAIYHSSSMLFEFDYITKMVHPFYLASGKSSSELINDKVSGYEVLKRLIHPDNRVSLRNIITDIRSGNSKEASTEIRIFDQNLNKYQWYKVTASAITDTDGKVIKALITMEDITSRHEETEELKNKANHDMLTGLLNRSAFESLVSDELAIIDATEKYGNSAMIILDIDNFKGINDSMGHGVGDIALQTLAKTLTSTFRIEDIIARLGGDEFVVWMNNIDNIETAKRRIDEVNATLEIISNEDVTIPRITISGGASTVKENDTFQSVYKNADDALYKAKNTGKKKCVIADN